MKFLEAISKSATYQKFATKVDANSPKILFVTGVVSVTIGVGTAIWGTIKATPKIDELKEKAKDIREYKPCEGETYSDKDRSKDLVVTYTRAVWNVGKYYIPTVAFTGFGIFCLGKGYSIQNARLVGMTAAYNMVSSAFNNYRAEVEKRYGADADASILKHTEEMHRTEQPVRKPAYDIGLDYFGRYIVPGMGIWDKDPNLMKMQISAIQHTFQTQLENDLLRQNLTINEVLRKMTIKDCKEGLVFGWKKGDMVEISWEEVWVPNSLGENEKCYKVSFNCEKLY